MGKIYYLLNKITLNTEIILVGFMIVVLPWIFVKGSFGFELPKIMGFVFISLCLGLLISFRMGRVRRRKIYSWLVSWLGWMGIASLMGVNKKVIFLGETYRWQGLLFYLCVVILIIVVTNLRYVKSERLLKKLWIVGGLGTVVYGLYQLMIQRVGGEIPTYDGRLVSSLGQPNFWADYLIVGYSWWWLGVDKIKASDWMLVVVMVSGVLMSGSRLGIYVIFAVTVLGFIRKKIKMNAWSVLAGLLMVVLPLWQVASRGWFDRRFQVWGKSIMMIFDRSIMGYGVDSLKLVLGEIVLKNEGIFLFDRSHNVFLDQALFGGLVGLMFFMAIVLMALKESLRRKMYDLFGALVVWIMLSSIHVVGVMGWIAWSILVGLCFRQGSGGVSSPSIRKMGLLFIFTVLILKYIVKAYSPWL